MSDDTRFVLYFLTPRLKDRGHRDTETRALVVPGFNRSSQEGRTEAVLSKPTITCKGDQLDLLFRKLTMVWTAIEAISPRNCSGCRQCGLFPAAAGRERQSDTARLSCSVRK